MDYSIIKNGAFKVFLDYQLKDLGLVIDSTYGGTSISLSTKFNTCICLISKIEDIDIIKDRLEFFKIKNISIVIGETDKLPFKNCRFDLVACHRAKCHNNKHHQEEIDRVLKNGGICYLSYEKEKKCMIYMNSGKKYINEFMNLHRYIMKEEIFHNPNFNDVHDIKSTKNKGDKKHKGWIRNWKDSCFNQNYGCVLLKRSAETSQENKYSLLKAISKKIKDDFGIEVKKTNFVRIGTGGSLVADFGNLIVRMPQTEVGLRLCEHNFATLNSLKDFKIGVEVPFPLHADFLNGQRYYIETKLKGISLDETRLKESEEKGVYSESLNFLFNKRNIMISNYDKGIIKKLIQKELSAIYTILNEKDKEIVLNIFNEIENEFIEAKIPTVITHGDFKQSNFICKNGSYKRIAGIIDWDRSDVPGLPFVDLLYLLVRRNENISRNHIFEMYSMLQQSSNCKIISDYFNNFDIEISLVKKLGLYCIVKYINIMCLDFVINREGYERRRAGQFSKVWYTKWISEFLIPVCRKLIE